MRIKFGLRLLIILVLTTGICRAENFEQATYLLGTTTGLAGAMMVAGSSYILWFTTTGAPNAEEKREDETDTESRELSIEEKLKAFALRFYQNKRGVRRDLLRGSGPHFDWILLRVLKNKYRPDQMTFRCLLLQAKPELKALLKTAEAKTALNDRSGTDALVVWLSQIDAESKRMPKPTFNRCALERRYSVFPDRMVQNLTKRRDGVDYEWVTEQYMGLDSNALHEAKAGFIEASLDLKNAFHIAAEPETRTKGFNRVEALLIAIAAKSVGMSSETAVLSAGQVLQGERTTQPSAEKYPEPTVKQPTKPLVTRSVKPYVSAPIKPVNSRETSKPSEGHRPFNLGVAITAEGSFQLGVSFREAKRNSELSIQLSTSHLNLGVRQYLFAIGPKASVMEPYIGARTHLWGPKLGLDYRNPTENDPGNRSYADVALSTTFGVSFSRKKRVRLALGHRIFFVQTHSETRLLEILHGLSVELGFYF